MELRCDSKLHGIMREGDVLEVKCRSTFCGYKAGIVILHRFNLHTGEMTTARYKDPGATVKEQLRKARRKEEHGTSGEHAPIRIAGRSDRSA
jgi:hypothetical protein